VDNRLPAPSRNEERILNPKPRCGVAPQVAGATPWAFDNNNMKTYQIYFLVYAFLGVILISTAILAQGIESLADVAKRHSIDAHDIYKLGCWFLGISTFLIVFDCLRLTLKENRRVLNLK